MTFLSFGRSFMDIRTYVGNQKTREFEVTENSLQIMER